VESRKEKRAADSGVMLRKSPAEMVMPLREVPGTTARACAAPMVAASVVDGGRGRAACARRFRQRRHKDADGDQHAADDEWIAPGGFGLFVEDQAGDADGDGADDESQSSM
jgi:hypothetical protein